MDRSAPLEVYFKFLVDEGWGAANPYQPTKSYTEDAGWDFYASREQKVGPGEEAEVHTDVAVAIPRGWYGHLTGRSSTLRRLKLLVAPAVIDAGYRGELFLQVINTADEGITIRPGHRIAQMIILPVPEVRWHEVRELPHSERGARGFGSSGH